MGFFSDADQWKPVTPAWNSSSGLTTVDPESAFKGDNGGTDLMGKITRAQWNHYKETFLPSIEKAMAEIGNEDVLNKQIARGEEAVNSQYSNAFSDAMNSSASLGANLDPDQANSLSRRLAFDKDKALGSVRNLTRQAKSDRDMQLIAGSASNLFSK